MLDNRLAALALAAITLAASGCGKSSKAESTTTAASATATTAATTTQATTQPTTKTTGIIFATGKPLSRKAWIAKGDVICARANAALNTTVIATKADYARVLPQTAGYDHVEAAELSKLVPPPAMEADWKQIVTGIQKFGVYTDQVAEKAKINDLSAAKPILASARVVHEQLAAIAKRDGFKHCSVI